MKLIILLACILTFNTYGQDCRIPVIDYAPKEIVGNYFLYEFSPKNSKDSILLIAATYDSVQFIQYKIMYANVHTMAATYKDPGVDKIKLDTNGNVLCRKVYAEGKTYDGRYKYISLDECTYDEKGDLLSESIYGTSNIPLTFAYVDSTFEEVIKQNYSRRASPDCVSRYLYKDGILTVIENYKDGALILKNVLTYTSGNLTQAKAYKADGTLFSIVECSYSSKGFTQVLNYYSEQNKEIKKSEDSYYWKYTKEKDRIVEVEIGKNSSMINKNRYVYDSDGRMLLVKMYDAKSLKYVHKYYYE